MSEKKLSDKLDGRPVVRWTAHNEPMFAVTRTEIAALEAKLEAVERLLRRLHEWDMMDVAGDGPYWRREIDAALTGVPSGAGLAAAQEEQVGL